MSGALAIVATVEPGCEAAFERWHTAEHVPERLALPGIRRARRFVSVPGTPASWLMLYDADDVSAFSSPAYRACLDAPTPRTTAVLATTTSTSRVAASVRFEWPRAGTHACGGFIAAWRFDAAPERRPGLFAWLYEAGPQAAASVDGVVRLAVLEGDGEGGGQPAPGREVSSLLLLIEGDSLTAVAEACQALQPLQAHGADQRDVLSFFSLQVDVAADRAPSAN